MKSGARIPERTFGALERYFKNRMPTGDFLQAVLENNLTEAVCRADPGNLLALKDIILLIYNNYPFQAWGSPEKVKAWLEG